MCKARWSRLFPPSKKSARADDEGQIKVNILHSGTGNISENDITLAAASQAIVMGFNVQADEAAR